MDRNKLKWIPISYCQFCIENNSTNAAKLFLYLKYQTDGITNKRMLKNTARYFNKSDRTIRRWLHTASQYNWIGQHNNTLFVRGWQHLFDTLCFQKKACFRFRKKDLKNFKTYCYAGVMSYMARVQIGKLEQHTGRSYQAPIWIPLASAAIAKTLNVSERTAQTYRKKAAKFGYIQIKECFKPLGIKVQEISNYRKYAADSGGNLIIKNGKVFRQLPSKIKYNRNLIHSVRRFKTNFREGTRYSMYAKSVQPT